MNKKYKQIAEETVAAIDAGFYKSPSGAKIPLTLSESRLYKPDWKFPDPSAFEKKRPTFEITNESTLEAALRLKDINPCVLNFASATNPGGGFLRGAVAQEESIARSSCLYRTLTPHSEFYRQNRAAPCVYQDYAIYSPDVTIFRNDYGELLETPYNATILTSAAPNMLAARNLAGFVVGDVEDAFYLRVKQVLNIMRYEGHTNLILGAWGCGAFGNDPWVIASFFYDALEQYPWFDNVLFAIYDKPESERLIAFQETFG